jgi:hypothetical protein
VKSIIVNRRGFSLLQSEREFISNNVIGDENNVVAPEIDEIEAEDIDASSIQEKSIEKETRYFSQNLGPSFILISKRNSGPD